MRQTRPFVLTNRQLLTLADAPPDAKVEQAGATTGTERGKVDGVYAQISSGAGKRMSLFKFFRRQSVIPFETCFAFFCVYSGLVGIFSWGIANDYFRRVLGETLSTAFNVAYLIAGLAVYFGIGLNRRDVEAFGLITVMSSLVVRSIVVYQSAGLDPVILNSYVYAAAFLVACVVRLVSLARYKTIVETQEIHYRPDG